MADADPNKEKAEEEDDVDETLVISLAKAVREQSKNRELADVILVVDGKVIPSYRFLLSACSGFFRGLFSSGMKEDKEKRVHIKNVSSETIELILESILKCRNVLTTSNAMDIWRTADMLQIPSLTSQCESFIKENINKEFCLEVYETAKFLSPEISNLAWKIILDNFEELRSSEDILEISCEDLERIILDDDLKIESEDDALELVLRWVTHSPTTYVGSGQCDEYDFQCNTSPDMSPSHCSDCTETQEASLCTKSTPQNASKQPGTLQVEDTNKKECGRPDTSAKPPEASPCAKSIPQNNASKQPGSLQIDDTNKKECRRPETSAKSPVTKVRKAIKTARKRASTKSDSSVCTQPTNGEVAGASVKPTSNDDIKAGDIASSSQELGDHSSNNTDNASEDCTEVKNSAEISSSNGETIETSTDKAKGKLRVDSSSDEENYFTSSEKTPPNIDKELDKFTEWNQFKENSACSDTPEGKFTGDEENKTDSRLKSLARQDGQAKKHRIADRVSNPKHKVTSKDNHEASKNIQLNSPPGPTSHKPPNDGETSRASSPSATASSSEASKSTHIDAFVQTDATTNSRPQDEIYQTYPRARHLRHLLSICRLPLVSWNLLGRLLSENPLIQNVPEAKELLLRMLQLKMNDDISPNVSSVLAIFRKCYPCKNVIIWFETVSVINAQRGPVTFGDFPLYFTSEKCMTLDGQSFVFGNRFQHTEVTATVWDDQVFIISNDSYDFQCSSLRTSSTFRIIQRMIAKGPSVAMRVVCNQLCVVGCDVVTTKVHHFAGIHINMIALKPTRHRWLDIKLTSIGSQLVVFGPSGPEKKFTALLSYDVNRRVQYKIVDIFGSCQNMATFQTFEQTFFLFRSGDLWELFEHEESGRLRVRLIRKLWDSDIPMSGALIVRGELWVFVMVDSQVTSQASGAGVSPPGLQAAVPSIVYSVTPPGNLLEGSETSLVSGLSAFRKIRYIQTEGRNFMDAFISKELLESSQRKP